MKLKLTAFDRFTLTLFPKWTADRVRARALVRHYDAAEPGRRTQGWNRSPGDANQAARGAIRELRVHARDLVRNNAWARRAQRVIANNTVGWGIVPKAEGDAAAQLTALWKTWAGSTACESEGRHTFYSLQRQVMKSIVESGEVLLRRRVRRLEDGLAVPLQLQILEADYLDSTKDMQIGQAGGPIIQGVEFDKLGRRAAYWIFPEHPGSGRSVSPSKRVDASEILHIFYTERPEQTRGVSWFAPVIVTFKDFDEYEGATLMSKKIASCFAAFVKDPQGEAGGIGGADDVNANPLVETFEPGMISYLRPGEDIVFANPPMNNDNEFSERQLRRAAAGLGITFEDLTGDYSKVNFSSARMARIAHWGNVHDWQYDMLIPQLCNGVWAWFVQAAQLAGKAPQTAATAALWTVPPMPMLEPDKEGLAYQRLIRTGLMTLSGALREQGEDPDTHLAEYAADNARLDALGLTLDSDPRNTTLQGQDQAMFQGQQPAPGAGKP